MERQVLSKPRAAGRVEQPEAGVWRWWDNSFTGTFSGGKEGVSHESAWPGKDLPLIVTE